MQTESVVTRRTPLTVPDQRLFWDRWHHRHGVASHQDHAAEVLRDFKASLTSQSGQRVVLELGCGQGREAASLARVGLEVHGVDHSPVAIRIAREIHRGLNVSFREHDVRDPLPFDDEKFAGVLAHLSLHYFSEEVTAEIFGEIHRTLQESGTLAFTVRSTNDPLFEKGERIGEDMYCLNGHVRHFFSDSYIASLMFHWKVVDIKHYDTQDRAVNPGCFFRVIAKKIVV